MNRHQRRVAAKLGSTRALRVAAAAGKRLDWRVDLDLQRAIKGLPGKHLKVGRPAQELIDEALEYLEEQEHEGEAKACSEE